MLETVIYGLIWCFAVYGILVMLQEIVRNSTYQKIEENVKLIMTVKNVENGIENYIRELNMGRNFYNNLVVIDLDSDDDTLCILKELEKENINLKILSSSEGKEYLAKQI
ncbi:MAG: hypothetical protein IJW20_01005 [Clostridia bacterium]|nr:hypothetical protein [Clostridia bacterium]